MSVILLLISLFIVQVFASSLTEGVILIQKGQISEGYSLLEEGFMQETAHIEKSKFAHLLAFAPSESIKTSPVYYARFTLKYLPGLSQSDTDKLKLKVADSFMEYGEFQKALSTYQEVLKTSPKDADYINYQLGYYHLNKGSILKAFELWSALSISGSNMRSHALKSIGRYWERMKFPGDISYLSSSREFIEGFSVSIDEREQELKLKDLDVFVAKGSSPSMLTLLIEKNPVFINDPCGFVRWYRTQYALPNTLIFPFTKKCVDMKKDLISKAITIVKAHAETLEEKSFLVSLYQNFGNPSEACSLAHKESMQAVALTTCEENSVEIIESILRTLKSEDQKAHAFLKGTRVIRSATGLGPEERRALMNVVGEEALVQEFLDNETAFFDLLKDLKFSDESLLKFVLYNGRSAEKGSLVAPFLRGKDTKDLLAYLTNAVHYQGDLCTLKGKTLKKIALESRIISQNLNSRDIACGEGLIEEDQGLFLLALDQVIKNSDKVEIDDTSVISEELKHTKRVKRIPDLKKISSLSLEKGKDVSSYLSVQNHPVRSIRSSEALLTEMKRLKQLRYLVSGRTWTSKLIAERTTVLFNGLLDEVLDKNQAILAKLKLQDEFRTFLAEMRII